MNQGLKSFVESNLLRHNLLCLIQLVNNILTIDSCY